MTVENVIFTNLKTEFYNALIYEKQSGSLPQCAVNN